MKPTLTFDDVNILPKYSEVPSRSLCNTSVTFCGKPYKTPILPSNMAAVTGYTMVKTMNDLGSIGVVHRFDGYKDTINKLIREGIPFAASIGVKDVEDSLEFLAGYPKFIIIDIAHGHSKHVIDTIKIIKGTYPKIPVVAGNIVTKEAALDLIDAGADAIKVGIGNGSMCSTRIMTGVGVPQYSALSEVVAAVKGLRGDFGKIGVISDGGVKTPGDIAKAIGAGASMVMSGALFAGTKETPPPIKKVGQWGNERAYKAYYGSASIANGNASNIEGVETLIRYKGSCIPIVKDILVGLKSSMSYVGAFDIKTFQENCEFVRVTQSGAIEAHPYMLLNKQ